MRNLSSAGVGGEVRRGRSIVGEEVLRIDSGRGTIDLQIFSLPLSSFGSLSSVSMMTTQCASQPNPVLGQALSVDSPHHDQKGPTNGCDPTARTSGDARLHTKQGMYGHRP